MFRKRVISSLCLTALLLLAFFSPGLSGGVCITLIFAALVSLGTWEFFQLADRMGVPGYPRAMSLLGGGLMILIGGYGICGNSAWMPVVDGICVVAILTIAFIWISRSPEHMPQIFNRVFVSLFGFFYVAWCLSFVLRLYFIDGMDFTGRYLALFLVAVTKVGDMGAYTAGVLTARRPNGNHKLAQRISPNKSWEGVAGGVAASILVALFFTWAGKGVMVVNDVTVINYRMAVVFGFFAAVFGLVGDLGASALKRAAGAKNSGRIPGIGGGLDLGDSLILVAPVFYLYVSIVVF